MFQMSGTTHTYIRCLSCSKLSDHVLWSSTGAKEKSYKSPQMRKCMSVCVFWSDSPQKLSVKLHPSLLDCGKYRMHKIAKPMRESTCHNFLEFHKISNFWNFPPFGCTTLTWGFVASLLVFTVAANHGANIRPSPKWGFYCGYSFVKIAFLAVWVLLTIGYTVNTSLRARSATQSLAFLPCVSRIKSFYICHSRSVWHG